MLSVVSLLTAILPSELLYAMAEDQNLEIEKDKTEAELDDNSDLNLKFFALPGGAQPEAVVFFSHESNRTKSSLFFEEVPTPPPLRI